MDASLGGHIALSIGTGDKRDVVLGGQVGEQRLVGRVPGERLCIEDMHVLGEDVRAVESLIRRIDEPLAVLFNGIA